MCPDEQFHPFESRLVLGPIAKPRWIYSCAKQLMDRVIAAYGQQQGLDYTLFRPFNWIGPGLDSLDAPKEGSSRVVTQFLGHIARGEPINLVDGGTQRRSFTDISDGIGALMQIIANPGGRASGQIYNIGNPANDLSVRELATLMLEIAREIPTYRARAEGVSLVEVPSSTYYGKGYEDIQTRVPWIDNTRADLGWEPRVGIRDALRNIFDAYSDEVAAAGALIEP
jgi:nucleoside-diphosphate-sugar epimerase